MEEKDSNKEENKNNPKTLDEHFIDFIGRALIGDSSEEKEETEPNKDKKPSEDNKEDLTANLKDGENEDKSEENLASEAPNYKEQNEEASDDGDDIEKLDKYQESVDSNTEKISEELKHHTDFDSLDKYEYTGEKQTIEELESTEEKEKHKLDTEDQDIIEGQEESEEHLPPEHKDEQSVVEENRKSREDDAKTTDSDGEREKTVFSYLGKDESYKGHIEKTEYKTNSETSENKEKSNENLSNDQDSEEDDLDGATANKNKVENSDTEHKTEKEGLFSRIPFIGSSKTDDKNQDSDEKIELSEEASSENLTTSKNEFKSDGSNTEDRNQSSNENEELSEFSDSEIAEFLENSVHGIGPVSSEELIERGIKDLDDLIESGSLSETARDVIKNRYHKQAETDAKTKKSLSNTESTPDQQITTQKLDASDLDKINQLQNSIKGVGNATALKLYNEGFEAPEEIIKDNNLKPSAKKKINPRYRNAALEDARELAKTLDEKSKDEDIVLRLRNGYLKSIHLLNETQQPEQDPESEETDYDKNQTEDSNSRILSRIPLLRRFYSEEEEYGAKDDELEGELEEDEVEEEAEEDEVEEEDEEDEVEEEAEEDEVKEEDEVDEVEEEVEEDEVEEEVEEDEVEEEVEEDEVEEEVEEEAEDDEELEAENLNTESLIEKLDEIENLTEREEIKESIKEEIKKELREEIGSQIQFGKEKEKSAETESIESETESIRKKSEEERIIPDSVDDETGTETETDDEKTEEERIIPDSVDDETSTETETIDEKTEEERIIPDSVDDETSTETETIDEKTAEEIKERVKERKIELDEDIDERVEKLEEKLEDVEGRVEEEKVHNITFSDDIEEPDETVQITDSGDEKDDDAEGTLARLPFIPSQLIGSDTDSEDDLVGTDEIEEEKEEEEDLIFDDTEEFEGDSQYNFGIDFDESSWFSERQSVSNVRFGEVSDVKPGEPTNKTNYSLVLDRAAFGLFGNLFRGQANRFSGFVKALNSARVSTSYDIYLSRLVFSSLTFGLLGAAIGLVISISFSSALTGYGASLSLPASVASFVQANQFTIAAAFITAFVGGLFLLASAVILYYYPYYEASEREREIETMLPHAVTFMYAMSRGGVNVVEVIRAISEAEDSYGEVSKEFRAIINNVDYVKEDLRSAIFQESQETSSDMLQSFLEDLLNVVDTGSDMEQFFLNKSELYLEEAREKQKQTLETLEVLSESYVVVFVASPIFILIILVVISLLGNAQLTPLYAMTYLGLPMGGFIFSMIIIIISSRGPRGLATLEQRESGEIYTRLEIDRQQLLDDSRYAQYRRMKQIRTAKNKLLAPIKIMRENPPTSLILTIPLAIFFIFWTADAGLIELTTDAFIDSPYWQTFLAIYVPICLMFGPLSLLHELRQRRRSNILQRLPEAFKSASDANERGLDVTESFEMVSKNSGGALSKELSGAVNETSWTGSFNNSLVKFANKINVPRLSRTIRLITKANYLSGDVQSVLTVAARDVENMYNLDRTRRNNAFQYLVVILVSFLVSMGVIVMLDISFLTQVAANDAFSGGSGGGVAGIGGGSSSGIPIKQFRLSFVHTVMVLGGTSGIVSGTIAYNDPIKGIKFALITMGLALAVFAFF